MLLASTNVLPIDGRTTVFIKQESHLALIHFYNQKLSDYS